MLAEVKISVKQQEIFEGINPTIKSFLLGKRALVEAGIEALLNLTTHYKSGRSYSEYFYTNNGGLPNWERHLQP